MENVIVHCKDKKGEPIDVNICYDVLDVVYDARRGTLQLNLKNKGEPHTFRLSQLHVLDDANQYLMDEQPCDCGRNAQTCIHRGY